jgi:hypothetical protein
MANLLDDDDYIIIGEIKNSINENNTNTKEDIATHIKIDLKSIKSNIQNNDNDQLIYEITNDIIDNIIKNIEDKIIINKPIINEYNNINKKRNIFNYCNLFGFVFLGCIIYFKLF